jgi:hypothetical protein
MLLNLLAELLIDRELVAANCLISIIAGVLIVLAIFVLFRNHSGDQK